VIGLGSGGLVLAQATPAGSEFLVNTEALGAQFDASTAMDADGDFVVVWTSYGQDADAYSFGISAQRYDSSGAPVGGELQVNSYGNANQYAPAVAMDDDGDFVVVWTSIDQDGFAGGVFAQRFDSSGSPAGGELQVNTYVMGYQHEPAVAMNGDGDFVVAWTSRGQDGVPFSVFAQRFSAAGSPLGGELQVESDLSGIRVLPAIAADADGDFVVVWQNGDQGGPLYGVFGRRFDSSGGPGVSFQANSYTAGFQSRPVVASAADGGFVVAWSSYAQDGSGSGVFAQRFGSSGAPVGSELLVNSTTASSQFEPTIALEGDGDFVVSWTSYGQDGSYSGVFAQVFDVTGAKLGGELMVNSTTAGSQYEPSVAVDDGGDFVVAWTGFDGDGGGVLAQRFDGTEDPPAGPSVTIDIKPDSALNTINLKSNGLIHVAILTTEDFDAWEADPSTVVFGPGLASPHGFAQAVDADDDGDLDMVLRFRVQDAGLACGVTSATLSGETNDGEPFAASDSVIIAGC
jgi:hypothetical protein